MSPTLFLIHIGAGIVGIISGAAALTLRKGYSRHRRAGNAFFLSMTLMAGIGAYAALIKPQSLSVLQGIFTIYLVTTAWLTVKRQEGVIGIPEYVAFLVVLSASIAFMTFGVEAMNSESGRKDGFPAVAYFVFGSMAVLATALDLHMIILGGVFGAGRIARHLWRMCYALFIGVSSLFLGQPQVFPESIRGIEFRAPPVIAVLLVMIFWLVRVRSTNWFEKAKLNQKALNKRTSSSGDSDTA